MQANKTPEDIRYSINTTLKSEARILKDLLDGEKCASQYKGKYSQEEAKKEVIYHILSVIVCEFTFNAFYINPTEENHEDLRKSLEEIDKVIDKVMLE